MQDALEKLMRGSSGVGRGQAEGILVPDTMLMFNSEDIPICRKYGGCKVNAKLEMHLGFRDVFPMFSCGLISPGDLNSFPGPNFRSL